METNEKRFRNVISTKKKKNIIKINEKKRKQFETIFLQLELFYIFFLFLCILLKKRPNQIIECWSCKRRFYFVQVFFFFLLSTNLNFLSFFSLYLMIYFFKSLNNLFSLQTRHWNFTEAICFIRVDICDQAKDKTFKSSLFFSFLLTFIFFSLFFFKCL